MADRIFIGQKQGRYVFRMSPPGVNASNLAEPSSFSSEGDYLRLHTIIDQELSRYQYEYQSGTKYEHYGTWGFDPLPYIPLASASIVHYRSELNGRIFYPGDNYPATYGARNDFFITISTNRLWVGTNFPNGYAGYYRLRVLIFKNRAVQEIT